MFSSEKWELFKIYDNMFKNYFFVKGNFFMHQEDARMNKFETITEFLSRWRQELEGFCENFSEKLK